MSVTTLPSRIGRLRPTIDSLLAQTVPPAGIFVCVPERSVREDCAYELPAWLEESPPGVQLVRCARDDGPATKLLGCLPHLPAESCLIVVDDDMVYRPFLVERLAGAQLARRDASFSFHVERVGRLRFGQGADGFSFWTPNLEGIEPFAAVALQSPHLFVEDDLWISLFLQNKGVAIRSVAHTLQGEFVWRPTHADGQLSRLTGELERTNVFRKGTQYLLRSGLLGPRLRLRLRVTFAERALTFPWRRLRSAREILPA